MVVTLMVVTLMVQIGKRGGKSKRPPVWEVVSTRGDGAGVLLNEYYEQVGDADA